MRREDLKLPLTIAAAAALALLAGGQAAAQTPAAEPLDCVIEPRALIEVGSKVDGILAEVAVGRGARVKKGQVLARLETGLERTEVAIASHRAKGDVEILSSRARLTHLTRRADRTNELYIKKVVSTEKRDEALTERSLAEFAVTEAEMNKRLRALELERAKEILARRTIRSPASGIVHERLLSAGEFVHEQAPLVIIAEINPLYVEVFVPIALYGTVRMGMTAKVKPVAPVGGTYTATVTVVDKVFDAASGTFGVRLELPNPAFELPAGIKCTVDFAAR